MKRYIHIILSIIMSVSAVTVSAETLSTENGEESIFIEAIEMDNSIIGESVTDTFTGASSNETQPGILGENEETVIQTEQNSEEIGEEIVDISVEQAEETQVSLNSISAGWEEKAAIPNAGMNRELVTIDDEIYAVGGMGESGHLNKIEKYSPASNSWSEVTEIPDIPNGFAAAADESKIYIIGGYKNGYLNTVRVYDVNTGEWSFLAPMKERRDQPTALVTDNKLYVFGGRNVLGIVYDYEYYDFSEGTWNKVTTGYDASMCRVGAHAALIGEYMCIYGGFDGSGDYKGVNVYHTKNMKESQELWQEAYESISAVSSSEKMMIFAWNRDNDTYDVQEISTDAAGVSIHNVALENTPLAAKFTNYILCGGYLYAVGGYDIGSRKYLKNVSKYSVYYGDYSSKDITVNSEITAAGNSLTFNLETGKEYMLFVNAGNISTFADCKFKLEYDDNTFTLVDGCAFTAEPDTFIGQANGTDIVITKRAASGIVFRCLSEVPDGVTMSGTVNAVILRANASGWHTVKYSIIKE